MRLLTALFMSLLTNYAFAETETLVCNYTTVSAESGTEKVREEFVLTFVVDTQKNLSYLVANAGSSEVLRIPSMGGVTFIEQTPSGNIMTTTIDSHNSSVHSRNTIIAGLLVSTQYYGKCINQ